MATLSLKGLVKDYGEVRVVKDFNLEVGDKEFVVLVGPSGCGKSTTLRMIAGLEEISSGELRIDDKRMNDVAPKDRDIAMVFQSYALYPHMTVFDNMAFGLKLRKYPKDEINRRVKHASEILGLSELLDRKPKALSGGQRQRVAMGRAIVREPKVFLFDEPLSNLDAKLRVQMRSEIARLHRNLGATSIYVTHDQTEAMTLATRIVVMNDGIVQQVGAPLDLYRTPDNLFVAGFIGSPGMNFLEGEVAEDRQIIRGTDFEIPCAGHFPALKKGQKITIGFRPEVFRLGDSEGGVGQIKAKVDFLEPMGAELFVFFHVDEKTIVGRFAPETQFEVGEEVTLSVDANKLHIFDPETELAIRA